MKNQLMLGIILLGIVGIGYYMYKKPKVVTSSTLPNTKEKESDFSIEGVGSGGLVRCRCSPKQIALGYTECYQTKRGCMGGS
jgi:hypothetical protein